MGRSGVTIFPDHSDVMTTRVTGWALLNSGSVQEAHDLALVSHLSAMKGNIPFIHFYDGFRTSHEIAKIEYLEYEEMAKLLPQEDIKAFRARAFNPEHPKSRGSVINNDVMFQVLEASHQAYNKLPNIVQETMDDVKKLTGRSYHLFDYVGHPEAKHVALIMGSAGETMEETVKYLNARGEKVGVIRVRLYRPFSHEHLLQALPKTVKVVTVMDRVREYGSNGEPLYLDVSACLSSHGIHIPVINGVYGVGGKDFTATMAKTVYDNMKVMSPKRDFTVGIIDDVLHSNLPLLPEVNMTPKSIRQCVFWGIGADGTVGANKEAISIISENTDLNAQGYFMFEAKKSGGWTVSHLRFGPEKIQSEYEIVEADYVACHNEALLAKYPIVDRLKKGGILVFNSSGDFDRLPPELKRDIAARDARLFNINATKLSYDLGMPGRINMMMQVVFFKLAEVVDVNLAMDLLKNFIRKQYAKKGQEVVDANIKMLEASLDNLKEIKYPKEEWLNPKELSKPRYPRTGNPVLDEVIFPTMDMKGNEIPVSKFLLAVDGYYPNGTSAYEKRDVSVRLPVWDAKKCTQCNQCVLMCPHACIRPFLITEEEKDASPYPITAAKARRLKDLQFRIQVSPYDCISCGLCAEVCPDAALTMTSTDIVSKTEYNAVWEYVRALPDRKDMVPFKLEKPDVRSLGFQTPLLEFSAACAGCGETAYMKALTQMFGDRMYISNAHGCSIVWASTFPSFAYTTNEKGHGPAWGSSLFEDAAEFGLGMSKAIGKRRINLRDRIIADISLFEKLDSELAALLKKWTTVMDDPVESVAVSDLIKIRFSALPPIAPDAPYSIRFIHDNLDILRKPSQWIIGGDGWAYDIGFNGLDHVMSQTDNVNILVMDNEAYANTGFQLSKSTPHGSVVKFAALGNRGHKKDLGMIAMAYGHVYVASVAMGANKQHYLRAVKEAEAYNGPSIVLAYCPCIGHGIDGSLCMSQSQQELAVQTGYWPLYRYNPDLRKEGKSPFILDCKEPTVNVEEFLKNETRYSMMMSQFPDVGARLHKELQQDVTDRWRRLENLAKL
eukprot:TRINITY_DN95_c0_g1_i1.p1 TRINITY_DN95_c0_g1~~TRINITY_DN95_c0_g1_i1.p1  ORF type:complete len:1240 (+),score=333.54 TRINITY_DN95_c0_g1_i1:532-3720(+)